MALLVLQITDTAKARTFTHQSPVTCARTQLAEASEFKATGALGGTKRLANDGVGLLFMSYQSSIQDPFRFMQSTWVNNPGFESFLTLKGSEYFYTPSIGGLKNL